MYASFVFVFFFQSIDYSQLVNVYVCGGVKNFRKCLSQRASSGAGWLKNVVNFANSYYYYYYYYYHHPHHDGIH